MIHTLETISLANFINVFIGEYNYAGENEDDKALSVASEKMIAEYIEVIGGKSVQKEIYSLNEDLNNKIKSTLMDNCEILMQFEEWSAVSVILSNMGYSILPEDKEKIKRRIMSIKATCALKNRPKEAKIKDKKVDKDYFIQERSLLMSHYKMYIDPNIYRAKEYAYLVKNFTDEIKAIKSISHKK